MKNKTIILFLLCIQFLSANARQTFIPYGKITFEKKVNLIKTMESWNLPTEAKEKMQKYVTSDWAFFFNPYKSLYQASKKEDEEDNKGIFSFSTAKQTNEIYTDYSKNRRVLRRNIMGEDYLLSDTIPHVNWKIMHDMRKIAGYECRKAIGIIHDTIYVVAFYTDEILLRGGPEGFNGLPGMILGLAIPRYNTTWFATRVDGFANHFADIIPATVGKKIETDKDLRKLIELFIRYDLNKKEKSEEVKKRLYGFTL